jgi:hypothetical protein
MDRASTTSSTSTVHRRGSSILVSMSRLRSDSAQKAGDETPSDTRSITGAAIRRGEIEISGPIPITEDIREEDFSARHGMGNFPLSSSASQHRLPMNKSEEASGQHAVGQALTTEESSTDYARPEQKSSPPRHTTVSDSRNGNFSSGRMPVSHAAPRNSTLSEMSTNAPTVSGPKPGRLRSIARKLFGRKGARSNTGGSSKRSSQVLDPDPAPKHNSVSHLRISTQAPKYPYMSWYLSHDAHGNDSA